MFIKRTRIGDLVLGTLVLSSCFITACAVAIDNVEQAADEGGQSGAGSGSSGVPLGGSVGSTSASGGTGSGGKSAAGKGGNSALGGGGKGNGGATGAGGRGGVGFPGSGGKGGGSATAGGGRGGAGTIGSAGRGGVGIPGSGGKGGGSATGGAGTGTGTVVKLDLSKFQPVAAGTYSGTAQTLGVVAQPFIQFPLPRTFTIGQSVAVHVAGTNKGTVGLRSWLVDSAQTTLSNVVTTYVGAGLPAGSFMLDYTLTATGSAGFLFFKAPSSGTNIDNVTISSITITY